MVHGGKNKGSRRRNREFMENQGQRRTHKCEIVQPVHPAKSGKTDKTVKTVKTAESAVFPKEENKIKKEDICLNCFGAGMGDCDRCTRYGERRRDI